MPAKFDLAAFGQVQFDSRVQDVPVPELAEWFRVDGEEVKPEQCTIQVRNLTAGELSALPSDADSRSEIVELVSVLLLDSSKGGKESAANELREVLGLSPGGLPLGTRRMVEMIITGSVEPKLNIQTALKLQSSFQAVFFRLANAIGELTKQGGTQAKH